MLCIYLYITITKERGIYMPSDKNRQQGNWEIRKESVDFSQFSAAFKNIPSAPQQSTNSSQSQQTNNSSKNK